MSGSNCSKLAMAAALLVGGAMLTACGGGGGGGTTAPATAVSPPPPPPPPPPTSQSPTWTQGVFEASDNFKDLCVSPRPGVDLAGDPFTDEQGDLLDELFWLRSWSDETYLWNEEIVDQNPANFSTPLAYFEVLKTDALTASGTPRDQFHFTRRTDEYLEARLSAPTSGYGLSLVAFSDTPPRDFRVRYTEPNSPASEVVNGQQNFLRGTRILQVDGVDLVNATGTAATTILNEGLFPENAGETHTFMVQDAGASSTRSITVVSADVVAQPVNRTRVIDTPTGKVGYIMFNTFSPFSSEAAIAGAFREMESEGVSDLVLDLRYNGGGLLAIAAQVGYMIAGPNRTANKVFDELIINDNPRNPLIGAFSAAPFYNTGQDFSLAAGTPLDDLNLGRVFILSTGRTCSASEAVINGLRGIDVEVILIGGKTCGKPYGFFATDNCGETYFTIQFGGINDKGFGEYSDGFLPNNSTSNIGVKIPGCSVADDYDNQLGDPNEALLAAALNYRETGVCPTVSFSAETKVSAFEPGMKTVATSRIGMEEELFLNSKEIILP